jgi:hypothetical protein
MEESQDFYFYPTEQAKSSWTTDQARNQYLNNWWMNISDYQNDTWRRTIM